MLRDLFSLYSLDLSFDFIDMLFLSDSIIESAFFSDWLLESKWVSYVEMGAGLLATEVDIYFL